MEHWISVHTDDALYVCPYCGLDMATSAEIVWHVGDWHPDKPVRVALKASQVVVSLFLVLHPHSRRRKKCQGLAAKAESFAFSLVLLSGGVVGSRYTFGEVAHANLIVLMEGGLKSKVNPQLLSHEVDVIVSDLSGSNRTGVHFERKTFQTRSQFHR